MKVLHILQHSPISKNFIDFISGNFNSYNHEFVTLDQPSGYNLPENYAFNLNLKNLKKWYLLNSKLADSDKVIVHGFFQPLLFIYFLIKPSSLSKVYWVIWGADLYYPPLKAKKFLKYRLYEHLRSIILTKVPCCISYIDGDVDEARKNYNSGMVNYFNIAYPSNFFVSKIEQLVENRDINSNYTNIMIGNSADAANNHEFCFKFICENKIDNKFRIYCPLSYGDKRHAEKIKKLGSVIFSENFFYLDNLMPPDEYSSFLNSIDIAIFYYNYQQGMGNIIKLIGMGKTVYLNPDTSQFRLLKEMGLEVFSIYEFSIDKRVTDADRNTNIIKEFFSEDKCISQWRYIFECC